MKKNNRKERKNTMTAAGVNTGKYFSIQLPEGVKPGSTISVLINENGEPVFNMPEELQCNDHMYNQIFKDGYVRNTRVHRRWVMAQMFKMLSYKGRYEEGYNACLRDCYPYMYQFDMMIEEVRVLSKLEKRDKESFNERSHFFTHGVIMYTCEDYLKKLRSYIYNLKEHKCKGIPYKRICGRDVFVCDLQNKIYYPLEWRMHYLSNCCTYEELYNELLKFKRLMIKLPAGTPKCKQWIDAFKGAGSYYTLMNMVKFHGCFIKTMKDLHSKEDGGVVYGVNAVKYLEKCLDCYKGEYYKMFALLKKVIEDNNFDFYKKMSEM